MYLLASKHGGLVGWCLIYSHIDVGGLVGDMDDAINDPLGRSCRNEIVQLISNSVAIPLTIVVA